MMIDDVDDDWWLMIDGDGDGDGDESEIWIRIQHIIFLKVSAFENCHLQNVCRFVYLNVWFIFSWKQSLLEQCPLPAYLPIEAQQHV